MPDPEFAVFLADIPPGGIASMYYHPGDDAIYMLQGALKFTSAGGQPFTLKAGEIAFNPAKHVHQAVNISTTGPAQGPNCKIAEKRQPLAMLAK
jgi:quercetin dioxygenase-like cupin family protein